MSATHRCDYCGKTYTLPVEEDIELCKGCGEFRIYNLRENRPSSHYGFVGNKEAPAPPVEDEERVPKKTKKTSKDLKAKRTSPTSYAETVKARYGYQRRG